MALFFYVHVVRGCLAPLLTALLLSCDGAIERLVPQATNPQSRIQPDLAFEYSRQRRDGYVQKFRQPVPNFRGMNILTPVVYEDAVFTSPHKQRSFMYSIKRNDEAFEVAERWTRKERCT